jgi:nicotinamidase-related amidase
MTPQSNVDVVLRSQSLTRDHHGRNAWEVVERERVVPAQRVAIVVCDMWDAHWCKGAVDRVNAMAPQMNEVLASARDRGVHIIHAPSETMEFYAGAPARERMREGARVDPPPLADRPDPPLPIDDSDGGTDTGETSWSAVWTRQHPALDIDQERDGISDDGVEIYSFLRRERVEQTLIVGVHTNMCVLNRSFGIKRMVRWGVSIALVRDLTDAMYNPERPPYVTHDEGTRLVVGYIEKFWCPTVARERLLV